MRVAVCVVLVSLCAVAGRIDAAPVVDRTASYPISVAPRNATAAQDAIDSAALQQVRSNTTAQDDEEFVNARVAGDEFDRRLASLDPTQIVYERSQAQLPIAQAGLLDLRNGRLFPRQEQRQPPRRQHVRSVEDFVLMGFAALMLVAYQLRKKHRFLRPHPFSY